jgi:peptide/nickel transport system substrate-binding protein
VASDWPEIKQTAEMIKEQWEKIGAQVNLEIFDSITLQKDYLKPRQYDALLFGQALAGDPDPFTFWHSSHSKDPGLNLALYQNKDVDKLLEEARQNLDEEKRAEQYLEFQKLVIDDLPAIFLFSPDYLYPVNKKVKGISEIEKLPTHTQRFSQIENWYIKTNRLWR